MSLQSTLDKVAIPPPGALSPVSQAPHDNNSHDGHSKPGDNRMGCWTLRIMECI